MLKLCRASKKSGTVGDEIYVPRARHSADMSALTAKCEDLFYCECARNER